MTGPLGVDDLDRELHDARLCLESVQQTRPVVDRDEAGQAVVSQTLVYGNTALRITQWRRSGRCHFPAQFAAQPRRQRLRRCSRTARYVVLAGVDVPTASAG
jgi:hypothetical protein